MKTIRFVDEYIRYDIFDENNKKVNFQDIKYFIFVDQNNLKGKLKVDFITSRGHGENLRIEILEFVDENFSVRNIDKNEILTVLEN